MIFTSENRLLVWNAHNFLEAEGIQCTVKNDQLGSIMGDLPVTECWAELWVDSDLHYQWAKELLAGIALEDQLEYPDWECRYCKERVSGDFAACWNCGKTQ